MSYPQQGIGFALQVWKGLRFQLTDNFSDNSIYWAWRRYNEGAGKIFKEEDGVLKITLNSPFDGRWDVNNFNAPAIMMGNLTYPVEIKAKIVDVPIQGDGTQGGLFISKAMMFGGDLFYFFGRRKYTLQGDDGLFLVKDGTVKIWSSSIKTLPIWVRFRLSSFVYYAFKCYFDYSLNGITWTNVYMAAPLTWFTLAQPAIGFMVSNGLTGTYNSIQMHFDNFQMLPRSID